MLSTDAHDYFATSVCAVEPPRKPSPPVATVCALCGTGLLAIEKAAVLCQCSRRLLYRWVEQGQLHFTELADGTVLICGRTLSEQINQREAATVRM
jgi:hypothetical protein